MKIGIRFLLTSISFLVLTMTTVYGKSINTCRASYKPKLPLVENFLDTINNKDSDDFNYLPLRVSEFVSREFDQVLRQYEAQLDLLRRVGDKNVLNSAMMTTKIAIDRNNKALEAIEKTLNPRLFSLNQLVSAKNRIEKIDKLIAETNNCKARSNSCSVELKQAIKETDANLKAIENLVNDLSLFGTELTTLSSKLDQILKDQYQENDIELARKMIADKQELHSNALVIAKTVLDLNKKNLITADFILQDFNILNQKTKEIKVSGADGLNLSGAVTPTNIVSRKNLLSRASNYITSYLDAIAPVAVVGLMAAVVPAIVITGDIKRDRELEALEARAPGYTENIKVVREIPIPEKKDSALFRVYEAYKHNLKPQEAKDLASYMSNPEIRATLLQDYSNYLQNNQFK